MFFKQILIKFIVFSLIFPTMAISACWNDEEISELSFARMDGIIAFSFRDAVSCQPISDAHVKLLGLSFYTDTKGYVRIPENRLKSNDFNASAMTVKKDGYCTFSYDVRVNFLIQQTFLLSKVLPIGKARFILQWKKEPRDLDLHLLGKDFHISYRNMKRVAQKANLDRDDTDGHGPETITLDKILESEPYDVYVHNYSGEKAINNALISVYKDNKLDRVLSLPKTNNRSVKVLEIRNRKIFYKNISLKSVPEYIKQ